MKKFNYRGRVVTAASKGQAVRKVVANIPDPRSNDLDGRDPEARYTDEELKAMAKKDCDLLKSVIEGARVDMDFLQRLSWTIAREKLGPSASSGLTIEANGEPLFTQGHKYNWGNGTWNGNNSELEMFRIEHFGCLDYIYFNVSNCKATLSGFDVVNMHRMGNTWVWDDYAKAEFDGMSYSDL